MKLHQIQENEKTIQKQMQLPRLNKQFIGIGHELQLKRKDRRRIDLQQRTIQNRVLYLQKQQQKAHKDLINKRKNLQQIISVKQRQEQQSRQKNRYRQENMQKLLKLQKQNQYMRMMHKHNLSNTIDHIRERKQSDYSRVRKQRIDGQYKKKVQRNQDIQQKKDQWLTLNVRKQMGKIKVDKFYKSKNKEHLQQYSSRIKKEEKKMSQKLSSMQKLEERQKSLKEKLEKSIMKNSNMAQLIQHISKTVSPNSSRIISTLENNNIAKESQKKIKSERGKMRMKSQEEIEQNLQISNEDERKSNRQFLRAIKKKKKNKHINRYKEYQAF